MIVCITTVLVQVLLDLRDLVGVRVLARLGTGVRAESPPHGGQGLSVALAHRAPSGWRRRCNHRAGVGHFGVAAQVDAALASGLVDLDYQLCSIMLRRSGRCDGFKKANPSYEL